VDQERSTLHVVDTWVEQQMVNLGYTVERERVEVQAFMPDPSVPHGFRRPLPHEPWYDAFNLTARKEGVTEPDRAIVLVAHKDSQSWLNEAPGAYDNAVGVAALLEIARLLTDIDLASTVLFLFCNEEHWPWTSVAAAEKLAASNLQIAAVLNVDGIGGRAPSEVESNRHTHVTRFVNPEGEHIADLMDRINETHQIGLLHRKHQSTLPNDDDGSFIKAGILPAVMNIGSMPYADPNYHTVMDRPELVDVENVAKSTHLILATLLELAG
jgi:Zn-dependent M28 family amino/carboxypeptidase